MEKKEIKEKVLELMDDMRLSMESKLDKLLDNPDYIPSDEFGKWGEAKVIMAAICEQTAKEFSPPKNMTRLRKRKKAISLRMHGL